MEVGRGVAAGGRVVAVLGPTNTGKTHLALERMLGHASGMIGFPLRLLARENYDRIVRLKGERNVALVTGEERIVPPGARWFVCTTEAMPLTGRTVDFLAIDEIQLIADRERGHVFTDRLLRARGNSETMVLGAATARPVIRRLVPFAEFVERPRLSTLTHTGPRKITRLPRRSAVVAFSANDVYRIAELIRRQRGGAAVVFGALSPRTRNAQVAMYQAGEVDWLVATDAIGMGLNMDIGHVAFAELSKFDGHALRRLTAAELGQIAGRAGRHMTDGSFGTTAEAGSLEPELASAIEEHRFPAISQAFWRNAALDFAAPAALLASLEEKPPAPELIRTRTAEDHAALSMLARDADVLAAARGRARVALLWETCQIPDFRKAFDGGHARFVKRVFLALSQHGRLPSDWVVGQVARLDAVEGDIDTLLQRIAEIRTWTYIAHKGDWLAEPVEWQARTRAIEDKLSDALHARLTQRFVDRRAAAVARRRAAGEEILAGVTRDGEVVVEGESVGALSGFAFVGAPRSVEESGEGMRAVMAAANRVLRQDVGARVRRMVDGDDTALRLAPDGALLWDSAPVARLAAGPDWLAPRIDLLPTELLDGPQREAVRRRLAAWLEAHCAARLEPLLALRGAALTGAARGLAYELVAGLGCVPRTRVATLAETLGPMDRAALAGLGVVLGTHAVFLPALRDQRTMGLRSVLRAVFAGVATPQFPPALSYPRSADSDGGAMAALFCLPAGPRFVRADRLEKLGRAAGQRGRGGPFAPDPAWAALIGAPIASLEGVLRGLGFKLVVTGELRLLALPPRPRHGPPPSTLVDTTSPFAELARLVGQ